MKPFSLYLGDPEEIRTTNVTNNQSYQPVVNAVQQIRRRFLEDPILRQPFVDLFTSVYHDDTPFPNDLRRHTPAQYQVSNEFKIQQIRHQPPTHVDVIDYLTNAFPDLYLISGEFGTKGTLCETVSGRQDAGKERIGVNAELIQSWLFKATGLSLAQFAFMFIAVFLHELGHNALVWYSAGACNSPQLGGVNREAGFYIEKRVFGGVTIGEFEKKSKSLSEIGVINDNGASYFIDKKASQLTKLDTSNGLPLINLSLLVPAPPAVSGFIRSELHSIVSTMDPGTTRAVSGQTPGTVRSFIVNDKKWAW